MKLLKPIEQFQKMDIFEDTVKQSFDRVLGRVGEMMENGGSKPFMDKDVFYERLHGWCEENSDEPARLLSITVWADNDDESVDEPELARLYERVCRQFDGTPPATKIGSETIVVLVPEKLWSNVGNDFDWANQMEGLASSLNSSLSVEFVLKSVKWPEQASSAVTLLDSVVPHSEALSIESSSEQLLTTLVRNFLNGKLPRRLEESITRSVEKNTKRFSPF